MTVALYLDHHVPAAVAMGLRSRGVDVLTCADDGAERWEDARILERAGALGRAVFSQDDDFLVLAADWLGRDRSFAGLLYAHPLAITIGQAVRDLEVVAKVLEPDELRDRIVFLPLSA